MWKSKTPGIPDEEFERTESVPITKEEIRAIQISKGRLSAGQTVLDIGCGSGSVTVEAAIQVEESGKVIGVDIDPNAIELTKKNLEKFGISNYTLVEGNAKEKISELPQADTIFIGGTGGDTKDIVELCQDKVQSGGRIVIGVILIETLYSVLQTIEKLDFESIDITQITIGKSRKTKTGTMMLARNPVTVISATKKYSSFLIGNKIIFLMSQLTGIGVGPGDPDLLTVKAVKAIQNADTIMCPASKEDRPSIALSVVDSLIDKSKNQEIVKLIFPMTKDKDILEAHWKENSKIMAEKVLSGKNVVYLTVGDPYLYSTWIYMHREISQNHPEMKINVIPGIVSMFTFASKVGVSIAEGAEKVSIIPSCYDLSSVKEIAKNSEVLVFLKDGRYFDQVIELVRESGFPDDSIFAIGQDLGTDKEIIRKLRLGDVNDDTLTTKYFSILVIKRV